MTDPVIYTSIVRRPCPGLPPPPPKSSLESAPGARRRPWDPWFLRPLFGGCLFSEHDGRREGARGDGVLWEEGSLAAGSSLLNEKIEWNCSIIISFSLDAYKFVPHFWRLFIPLFLGTIQVFLIILGYNIVIWDLNFSSPWIQSWNYTARKTTYPISKTSPPVTDVPALRMISKMSLHCKVSSITKCYM